MKRADADRGFTFVELVVVITILSVMLGFCIPLFRDIGLMTSRGKDASDLARRIQALKQKAVARDMDCALHIHPGTGLVYVTDETMDERERAAAKQRGVYYNGSVDILSLELPGEQEGGRQTRILVFSRRGYSDRALIHLRENRDPVTLKVGMFATDVQRFDRYVSYDDCL